MPSTQTGKFEYLQVCEMCLLTTCTLWQTANDSIIQLVVLLILLSYAK